LPLFRQVHEFHVFEGPDLYKENSIPVEQEFFESQLMDSQQHIFVATIGNGTVGGIVTKEEEIMENSFVKGRKVLFEKSLCVAETHR
jgi:ribosomal protein S18 acetylase RimI-like enzyme